MAEPMTDARVVSLVQQELRGGTAGILIRQLQSFYRFGDGAPTADPGVPRAVYLDRTGAAGSIAYVWDGSAWTAFA